MRLSCTLHMKSYEKQLLSFYMPFSIMNILTQSFSEDETWCTHGPKSIEEIVLKRYFVLLSLFDKQQVARIYHEMLKLSELNIEDYTIVGRLIKVLLKMRHDERMGCKIYWSRRFPCIWPSICQIVFRLPLVSRYGKHLKMCH